MQTFAKRVGRYLPLLAWMVFISFASTSEFSGENTSRIIRPLILWLFPHTTEETLAVVHVVVRKIAHFSEYFVLGFLAARAFSSSSKELLRRRWFVLCLTLIIVYSLVDEYHQSFVPSRTPSIFDSMIDTLGGLTALLVYSRRSKRA
jgi:VanZ family protein